MEETRISSANKRQVGGLHYNKYGAVQPWDMWALFDLNAFQGAIVKHVIRYRDKLGIEDLKKARHYLDKLIEVEEAKAKTGGTV